jgi:hypothetical protein
VALFPRSIVEPRLHCVITQETMLRGFISFFPSIHPFLLSAAFVFVSLAIAFASLSDK